MKKISTVMIVGVLILFAGSSVASCICCTTDENDNSYSHGGQKSFFNGGPQEEWNITFGGDDYDVFFTVQETTDGGFIALGGIDAVSWDVGGDCLLLKTDGNGNILWNKRFGGSGTDNGHGLLQTDDGGYIISAITESYGAGSYDAWVIKTDMAGNELWNKTYGGSSYDLAEKSIPNTVDGGYLLVGSTLSFGTSSSRDGWLIKIDENGNELWNKTYGTENDEHLWEVHITSDNGFIMIGYVDDSSNNRRDAWVIKTDALGIVQWEKKVGPAHQGLSITQTGDGGYLLLAEVEDTVFGGYLNAWMVKLDVNGVEQWNKLFITPQGENCFAVHHNIQPTLDGAYIVTGVTNAVLPVFSVGDMWLSKIDDEGNILWDTIIGGDMYDTTYTVDATSDGGFIVSGMTKSFGSGGNFNAWLIKVLDYENQRPDKPEKPEGESVGTPGKNYTYSCCATEPDGEQLYYIWDWGDGNYTYWLGPYSSGDICEATYSWAEKGDYSIRVKVKDIYGGESDWSDPLSISMPVNKPLHFKQNLFNWLFEVFSNLFPLRNLILRINDCNLFSFFIS